MASSYTGIFVQKDSSGNIHTVQVKDTTGTSLPLDIDVYISRGIKPPADKLPDVKEFELLKSIAALNGTPNPAPETSAHINLVKHGYITRITRPIENSPSEQAIVGHEITEKGINQLKQT